MRGLFRLLAAVLISGAIAACGGGGGSPGTTSSGGTDTTGTGTTDGTGGSGTTTATPTLQVTLLNAQGAEVNNVDSSGGYSARATVRDASGAAASGVLVTFSLSDGGMATLTPTTALTNTSGVAEVAIAPTSFTSLGAATVNASATVGTSTLTGKKDFAVSASNLVLSALNIGQTNLASGGNTSIAVTATVNGAAPTAPVNVTFSTTCGRINGQAGSFSVTTDGTGLASASYTAVQADGSLCSGPQTLTATAPSATARTGTVTIAAPTANALTFVDATPGQIYVAGSGALEQSVARFKVLAGTAPMANQTVTFSLTVNPGGVGLGSAGSTTPVQATTDGDGEATISVFSGTIPGPVRVRATLDADPLVFAESQNLTVASGLPSQRFMSLSVQTSNIEGADRDGTPTTLTARIADRQGNAVEDGTVVNFTSEAGQVAASCATTKSDGISSCSVTFVSQNPRPPDGRVSVLAYTTGTKDYVDLNGNNRYDAGVDTLVNIGDAYRDDNEDDQFNPGEFVIPRGGAGACAGAGDAFPARENTCDTELATTVRQQAIIVFSESTAGLKNIVATAGGVSFRLHSANNPNLPMPAGTAIAASTSRSDCAIANLIPGTVQNIAPGNDPTADLSSTHVVQLEGCMSGDQINLTITSPAQVVTTMTIPIP